MAGFLIAIIACAVPFCLGVLGLGRARAVVGIGGVLALGWIIALAAKPADATNEVPLWFVAGLVLFLYAIWCGGLWLGLRVRRIRRPMPG